MNIDERIRKELERQNQAAEHLDAGESGLFAMLNRVFTGGLRRWAAYAMFLTLAFFALTVWCIWQVFTVESTDLRILWALGALFGFHAASMLKLWFFMEMNRNSVLREIKRVEIAVARLDGKDVGK